MTGIKRYFYDCEFIEDGHTIELVSIGIAAEDGRTYYAVNRNVRWERLGNPKFAWIRENVWPHLPLTGPKALSIKTWHPDVRDRVTIAEEVKTFLLGDTSDGQIPLIELWGDYPAYDHVCLAQLWGRMIDLPEGIPMRTNDLVLLSEFMGTHEKDWPQQDPSTQHHALHDAMHNMKVFFHLFPQKIALSVEGIEGLQIGNGGVQVNNFGGPRRGEEGNPSVSLMTRGKTYGGRPVTDISAFPAEPHIVTSDEEYWGPGSNKLPPIPAEG